MAAVAMLSVSCRNLPFETQILSYDGNKVSQTFVFDGDRLAGDGAGQWSVDVDTKKVSAEAVDYTLTFTMDEGEMASGGAAVLFTFNDWDTENYVFAPAHIYGGNRFRIHKIGYAPFLYDKADRPDGMPVTTTNIPHLSSDGIIKVLAETSGYARANALGWNAFYNWPKVSVPAGKTVTVTLPVQRN